ncbi:MAG: NB-ARC domain-containing protein [Rivularia sp. (in: Bacteria)]|nr:NB-ARC domain-containing protein [Rivularia sp. MS3]
MSTSRRKIEEEFIEAKNNWDLEKLYIDLASAKGKALTPVEKKFLRGLLCGFSPAEIASKVYKTRSSSTVRVYLSNGLYKYIEEMLSRQAPEFIKVKNWSRVTQLLEKAGYKKVWLQIESGTLNKTSNKTKAQEIANNKSTPMQDWGEAVDTSVFYGRTKELTEVEKWILQEKVRLVVLLGMGGIGKTTFSVKLAELLKDNFDFIVWRSLRFAASPQIIFDQILEVVSPESFTKGQSISSSISQLVSCLRSTRSLIILDHVDSILFSNYNAEVPEYTDLLSGNSSAIAQSNINVNVPSIEYLPGYEAFGEFIQRLGESQHLSCLLLTSREKPQEIAALEGKTLPVRCLKLTGLNKSQSKEILELKGFTSVDLEESQQIMRRYAGNPLFIKLAATAIDELFAGQIDKFLQQETVVFGGIRCCLDEQFNRLSVVEKQIMYLLALNGDFDLKKLQKKLMLKVSQRLTLEAVELLQRRCLLEIQESSFSLTPVLREYLIEKLIEENFKLSRDEASSLLFAHTIFEKQLKNHLKVTRLNNEL